MPLFRRMAVTKAPSAVVIIRLPVGGFMLSEGIQKFLFPALLGAGRFATIGIPFPNIAAPFVGGVEIVGGLLLIVGFCMRIASIILLINRIVAIISTKLSVLLGHPIWGFSLPNVPVNGFWGALHEARADPNHCFCDHG